MVNSAIFNSWLPLNSQDPTTRSSQDVPDYVSELISTDHMGSKPLKGTRVGVIRETLGEGVEGEIISSIQGAAAHLEELGALVSEVFLE